MKKIKKIEAAAVAVNVIDVTNAVIIDLVSDTAKKLIDETITAEKALECVPEDKHEELVAKVNELRALAILESQKAIEKESKRKAMLLALEGKSMERAPLCDLTIAKGYATLTNEGKLVIGKATSWAQLYELAGQQIGIADFRTKKPSSVERRLIIDSVLSMVSASEHSLSRPDYDVRLRHLNTHVQSCVTGYHKGTRNA